MKHIFNYKLFTESTEIENMTDEELAKAKKELGEKGYRGFEPKAILAKTKPKRVKPISVEMLNNQKAKTQIKDKGYRSVGRDGKDTL